jgi:hypothetical protein
MTVTLSVECFSFEQIHHPAKWCNSGVINKGAKGCQRYSQEETKKESSDYKPADSRRKTGETSQFASEFTPKAGVAKWQTQRT